MDFFLPGPDVECQELETTFTKGAMARQFIDLGEEVDGQQCCSAAGKEVGAGYLIM